MNSKNSLPDDIVEASLREAVAFARNILPIIKTAVDHTRTEIMNLPVGGARNPRAEAQIAPAIIRMRVHQLIEGHNLSCAQSGTSGLPRRHVRNGAVCLVCRDAEFRLLKASKTFPTRRTGRYQESLINQTRFRQLSSQESLFGADETVVTLNGLIYYEMENLFLRSASVVIPDGFLDIGVNVVASESISIGEDFDDLATFQGSGLLQVLEDTGSIIVSEGPLDYDPHEQQESIDEEALIDEGFEHDTVFDREETEPEQ